MKDAALACGVNVLSNMGFAGMLKIDTIAITPPFTITEEELDEVVRRLATALEIVRAIYIVAERPQIEENLDVEASARLQ